MISEVGRVLEDPFPMFYDGPPLSALCRVIENDLRKRLGDPEIRPPLRPTDGISM
jgi:predicted membrane chloride channel (bestrophin family)